MADHLSRKLAAIYYADVAGYSFRDPQVLTRMEDGLRKAGLPE